MSIVRGEIMPTYEYIESNADYGDEDSPPWRAHSYGCSCCVSTVELTDAQALEALTNMIADTEHRLGNLKYQRAEIERKGE